MAPASQASHQRRGAPHHLFLCRGRSSAEYRHLVAGPTHNAAALGVETAPNCDRTVGWAGLAMAGPATNKPAFCAMRTSSASDWTCIFLMTRPRWTLIVFSQVPRVAAICLFN